MKTSFLRTLAVATGLLAISFGALTSVYGQKDYVDVATEESLAPPEGGGGGGGSMGCYNVYILDCGLQLGDRLICNFTGSYGAPYQCTEYGCYGSITRRQCVQGQ